VPNTFHHTEMLDIEPNHLVPIKNDWQKESEIPRLQNHLDIITKNPGVFPVEEICKFNEAKLTPFFTKIPPYSQINEEVISPYFPPGSDVNLKRLALKHKCKYMMSTSTITSMLNHLYYAMSNYKSPHF
jgi:hypothetical protein